MTVETRNDEEVARMERFTSLLPKLQLLRVLFLVAKFREHDCQSYRI